MSFAASSRYYRLEGTNLLAECEDESGNWRDSSLDLNTVLGNNEGSFDRNETDFARSAAYYGMNGPTLVARLERTGGDWSDASIDLNEVVKNINGNLQRA